MSLSVQTVLDQALAANGVLLGTPMVTEIFRTHANNSFKILISLKPDQVSTLQRSCDFPTVYAPKKVVTNDHALLAAYRELARDIYEATFKITSSTDRCCVIGAAAREIRKYSSNPSIHYYVHGKEVKDYDRIIRPAFAEILKMLKKKVALDNKNVFLPKPAEIDTSKMRPALKRYYSYQEVLRDWVNLQKLPCNVHTEETFAGKEFNTLLFEDSIYNYGPEELTDVFARTGAQIAYGYALLPLELIFPDFPASSVYRFQVMQDGIAILTFNGGHSNGYVHSYRKWSTLLRNPVIRGNGVQLVPEIVSRVGPMCVFKIMKANYPEKIARTIQLSERDMYVRVLDLWGSVDHRTCRINSPLKYESVKESEFFDSFNYLTSLDYKSLTLQNTILSVRRRMGGMALISKELVAPWDLPKRSVYTFSLTLTLYAMLLQTKTDEIRKKLNITSIWEKFARLIRTGMNIMFWPLVELIEWILAENLTDKLVVYPEHMGIVDQFGYIAKRKEHYPQSYSFFSDLPNEENVPLCPTCAELKESLGKQKMRCYHKTFSEHTFKMTDDEVKDYAAYLLSCTDDAAAGLKNVLERCLKNLPKTGFEYKCRVEYIRGGPGSGKSFIARAIADEETSLVVAPFTKLMKDYKGIQKEDGSKYDLEFKTQHRALDARGRKEILVDEFTSFDYRLLACSAYLNACEVVYLIGDTKQTKLLPNEGTYIGDKINMDEISTHELVYNFRNPPAIVAILNKLYGYKMIPMSSIPGNFTVVETGDEIDGAPISMAFSKASSKEYCDDERQTVRSFQGSTHAASRLMVTALDKDHMFKDSLAIVALSRHTHDLYFATDNCPNALKWLETIDYPTISKEWQKYIPAFVEEKAKGLGSDMPEYFEFMGIPVPEKEEVSQDAGAPVVQMALQPTQSLSPIAPARVVSVPLVAAPVPVVPDVGETIMSFPDGDFGPSDADDIPEHLIYRDGDFEVSVPYCETLGEFRVTVESLLGINLQGRNFVHRGAVLKNDDTDLRDKILVLSGDEIRVLPPIDRAEAPRPVVKPLPLLGYAETDMDLSEALDRISERYESYEQLNNTPYVNNFEPFGPREVYSRGRPFTEDEMEAGLAAFKAFQLATSILVFPEEPTVLTLGCPSGVFEEYLAHYLKTKWVHGNDTKDHKRYCRFMPHRSAYKFETIITMQENYGYTEGDNDITCLDLSVNRLEDLDFSCSELHTYTSDGGYLFVREYDCKDHRHQKKLEARDDVVIEREFRRYRLFSDIEARILAAGFEKCSSYYEEKIDGVPVLSCLYVKKEEELLGRKKEKTPVSVDDALDESIATNQAFSDSGNFEVSGKSTSVDEVGIDAMYPSGRVDDYVLKDGALSDKTNKLNPDFLDHLTTLVPYPVVQSTPLGPEERNQFRVTDPVEHAPRDVYLIADTLTPAICMQDDITSLNHVHSQLIEDSFTTAKADPEEIMNPVNVRGHPQKAAKEYYSLGAGFGKHFDSKKPAQEWEVIANRYQPKGGKSLTPHARKLCEDMVDLWFDEYKTKDSVGFFEDEEKIFAYAEKFLSDAESKHYQAQYQGLENPDARNIRFHLKAIFKPDVTTKEFNLFKAGQGISAWSRDAVCLFAFVCRLIDAYDRATTNSTGDNVAFTDNGISERDFFEKVRTAVNARLAGLPYAHGITDQEKFDASQTQVSQYLERYYLKKLGVADMIIDWYFSFREHYRILFCGGGSAKVDFVKTSGEPWTLGGNGRIAAVTSNWIIRGSGPSIILWKGDDFDKIQLSLYVDEEALSEVREHIGLNCVVHIQPYGEFCGLTLTPNGVFPNLKRKKDKTEAARFRDYKHFCEYQISLRDYLKMVQEVGVNNCIANTALNSGCTVEEAEMIYFLIESWSHLNKEQFESVWTKRIESDLIPRFDGHMPFGVAFDLF